MRRPTASCFLVLALLAAAPAAARGKPENRNVILALLAAAPAAARGKPENRNVIPALLAAAPAAARGKPENRNVILATTTSTHDSGLLDVLLPVFEKQTGYAVKPIAVGSGQAMAMGAQGEADVLLVHSPAAEEKFMASGAGTERLLVMHNDFVLVGPAGDPARLRQADSAAGAMKRIARASALFVSRGDDSGTHAREKALWREAGIDPQKQKWYQQTGLGMGQTLNVASEKQGYTLTDRGTWLALQRNLGLRVLCEGHAPLLNLYHVIPVDPARFPRVNARGGQALARFLVSPAAQKIIGEFGKQKYGAPLFHPDAGKKEQDLGK
jgi:tungstate transport system substrate-binding protein